MHRHALPLVLIGLGLAVSSCGGGRLPDGPAGDGPPTPAAIVELETGLTADERERWRFTAEGSDLVPVDALRALIDVDTGRTFADSLPRYGFLPSPASPANPYGLPVGWTTDVPSYSPFQVDYVGLNCSACHTGQIEVMRDDGTRVGLRIDGAPNLADIEALVVAAKVSVAHMLEHPMEALLFVWRLLELEPPPKAADRTVAGSLREEEREALRELLEPYAEAAMNDRPDPADAVAEVLGRQCANILRKGFEEPVTATVEEVVGDARTMEGERDDLASLFTLLARYRSLLTHRIELALHALAAIEDPRTPTAGPGRDDAWGIIRSLVFLTAVPLTAPDSIPHLYWADDFVWYHPDGNTNSVLQRNVAQALALGAYVDPATDVSSLQPRAVFALQDLMSELRAPAWPADHLGPIDAERAGRGAAIFQSRCAGCHHSREGTLFPLDEIGTDRMRAEAFLHPQGGQPFWEAIPATVVPLQAFAFEKAGVTREEAAEHEVADPTWRGTGQYQARRLDGVWSTAPYLHNGSVPTLYDLLLPPAERPTSFQLGDRAYDPVAVGYVRETADPVFLSIGAGSGHLTKTKSALARWCGEPLRAQHRTLSRRHRARRRVGLP